MFVWWCFCLGGRNGTETASTMRFLLMQQICWKYTPKKGIYITFWCLRFELRPSFLDLAILQVQHVVIPTSFWIIFLRYFSRLYSVISSKTQTVEAFARESNYQLIKLGKFRRKFEGFPDLPRWFFQGSPSFSCFTIHHRDDWEGCLLKMRIPWMLRRPWSCRTSSRRPPCVTFSIKGCGEDWLTCWTWAGSTFSLWWSEVTNGRRNKRFFSARKSISLQSLGQDCNHCLSRKTM